MYAQNVVPTNGSVGLAVEQPEEQLHVNGNIKTDSCVIVQDSIIVGKNARIGADMKVAGFLYVNENITGNEDLEITKDATIGKNLTVDKKIIAPNMPEANDANNKKIVVMAPNGTMKVIDFDEIVEQIYQPFLCPETNDGTATILPPVWSNSPGVLYTGTMPCTGYAKVGIGTDNPNARLGIHLNSNLVSNAILVNRLVPSTGVYNEMFKISSKGEMQLTVNSVDEVTPFLVRNEEGTKLLQIDHEGFLRTRRVRVDTETWPDYVFQADYKLKSLEEIDQFIQENGHLPNVPSAEEVETEGQDLGQMNKILMEKVEELTLHLINQNKRIKELEEKITNQETKK